MKRYLFSLGYAALLPMIVVAQQDRNDFPTVILSGRKDTNPIAFGEGFRCVFIKPKKEKDPWILVDRWYNDVWIVVKTPGKKGVWTFTRLQAPNFSRDIKSGDQTPESLCGRI